MTSTWSASSNSSREAREDAERGDHVAARDRYGDALDLIRGAPFQDLLDFRFARVAATRVEELVLAAHEGLADARLVTGQHAAAVAPLVDLVASHPLRERFHAQLVLALYRSGRQAEALRAFQAARATLLEELGLEPGAELQALERAVLEQDPSIDIDPAAVPALPQAAVLPGERDLAAWKASAAARTGAIERLPLVGRDALLEQLVPVVLEGMGGPGRVVLVEGEPGIGKTRLVEELGDRGAANGALTVWGRSYDGLGAPTFWSWIQVVQSALTSAPTEQLVAALEGVAAELAQVVPEVKKLVGTLEPPVPLDPDGARFRVFDAVGRFLTKLSAATPVVVVLDDLQWSDPASLELLAFLAGELDRARVVILATYRSVDPTISETLNGTLAQLSRQPGMRRVRLEGLDAPGLEAYLAAAGVEVGADVVSTLQDRTRGNPFFVGEVTRMFPLVRDPSDARAMGRAIPSNVKDLIRRRVGRLPMETSQALTVSSVLGHDFELALLATMLDLDPASLLERLEPAIQAGVLIESPAGIGRFRCSHGLVHEVLYDDMGVAQRARMHRRAAEALERRYGSDDGAHVIPIADHWFKAVPAAPAEQAVGAAIVAAQWGLAHVAHAQAEALLLDAVELLVGMPATEDRARMELDVQNELCLLYILTTSYAGVGLTKASLRIRELCQELGDVALLVPAMWRLSINYMLRGDLESGIAIGHELMARAVVEGPAVELAGAMCLGVLLTQRGDLAEARRHLDRAIELCDAGHDAVLADGVAEEPAVFARAFGGINRWLLGDEVGAIAEAQDSCDVAARSGPHAYGNFLARWGAAVVAVMCEDPNRCRTLCDEAFEIAQREGFAMGGRYGYLGAPWDWCRAVLDHDEDASDELRGSIDALLGMGAVYLGHHLYAIHAEACLALGRTAEALGSVEAGLALVAATGEAWYAADLHRLRAVAHAEVDPSHPGIGPALAEAIRVAESQGGEGLARRARREQERLGIA